MAWAWARLARCADTAAAVPGARAPDSWRHAARHGLDWLLPQAQVHWQRAHTQAALPFAA